MANEYRAYITTHVRDGNAAMVHIGPWHKTENCARGDVAAYLYLKAYGRGPKVRFALLHPAYKGVIFHKGKPCPTHIFERPAAE